MARWTPFPLIGGAYSDDTKPWSAQDCLNYIPVPAEREGTRSAGKLVGVPGMTTITASMQEAPVRGLHDVEGVLLAVTGNKLYRIGNDGAAAEIGVVPGVGMVSMAHNQVQYGHEVMIANGQSGYVYNTYTGEFGQVSDDGFPGFKVVDFIDGYIAGIEPQGRFWAHSNLRDAKDYNTLDRYDAESAPDKMVSLIVSHREVMILNQRSASFFRNVGTATGTFQNSNGTELEVGGASTFAVARLDNTVYWLGNDGIVYRLAGHSPQRISTGPIEQAIARCDISKAFAFTFEDRGHKVFYLTFPDGQTWGFDVWTNEWHRRASENLNRWRVNALVKWRGKWIAGDFSNGRLYQLDWAVQHEAGGVLERRRTTAVLHDNQNRVTVNAVELVVDTGLGDNSSPLPKPILPSLSIAGDLPDGFVGETGDYQYAVIGGVKPYVVTVISGSLPAGATMSGAGLVTYNYSEAATYGPWTVQAVDAEGAVASLDDSATIGFIDGSVFVGMTSSASVLRSFSGEVWPGDVIATGAGFNDDLSTAGGKVYAVATGAARVSHDNGDTWVACSGVAEMPTTRSSVVYCPGSGKWIIATPGFVYVSTDGESFTKKPIPNRSYYDGASVGNIIVFGSSLGWVLRSGDGGDTWAAFNVGGSKRQQCYRRGDAFITISPEGIWISSTGASGQWTSADPTTLGVIHGFAWHEGTALIVFQGGCVVSTDDCATWSAGPWPVTLPSWSGSPGHVCDYANGNFLMVGKTTFDDANIWSMPASGPTAWAVEYTGGRIGQHLYANPPKSVLDA